MQIGWEKFFRSAGLTSVSNPFSIRGMVIKPKNGLSPKRCRLPECREWFIPSRRYQIYHTAGCGLKARQKRFWKKWRTGMKRLQKQGRK